MSGPIHLFVVDDHSLFREGLIRLLANDPVLQVTGSADSVDSAFSQLATSPVDVLILDYDLGGETAMTLVRRLRASSFGAKILMVTAGLPNNDALELIRLGVSGIFHKQHSPEALHRSILDVAAGKVLIEQAYLQTLLETAAVAKEAPIRLTERDKVVLRLVLEGQANKEIAASLGISESAVKASLQQLFAKTGVRTRGQLVRVALEQLQGEL